MLVAMVVLILHFSAVPQNLISGATAATTKTLQAVPSDIVTNAKPSDRAQLVSSNSASEEPIPEESITESHPEPDSGVTFNTSRLVPKLVASASVIPTSAASLSLSPLLRVSTPFLSLPPAAVDSKLARQRLWFALGVAQHGAAIFDARSTRSAISNGQCYEADPLMRPFAGNASIYAVIQIGPALLDYLGRRMMTSRHSWVRHAWWIPQAMGTAEFVTAGMHNLGVCGSS